MSKVKESFPSKTDFFQIFQISKNLITIMDLLGMLKDQVSGQLVGQASKFLGESESGVSKALDGIFPSLLGSAIQVGESESGASKIMDLIGGMDNSGMDDIAGIFSGGASGVSKLMNQGSGIANLLMGNKSGGMIDTIAKFSGLKGSSSSSLMKMAAPFLMSMIGKQVMGKGASGLMSLLGGQKDAVKSAMPAGLGSSLGLGFLGDAAGKVISGATDAASTTVDAGKKVVGGAANMAGNAVDTTAKAGGSLLKYIIPALLALLVLGFFGFKTGCGAVDNMAEKTADVTGNVVGGAADMAKKGAGAVGDAAGAAAGAVGDVAGAAAGAVGDAAGAVGDVVGDAANAVGGVFANVNEAAKAALGKITFAAGSAGSQMKNFIDGGFKGDSKFTFKGLTFATGSAQIDAKTASEIDNVAAILKAYPDVKIAVSGYTDNTGDAAKNVALSQARAESVKARLMGKNGIDGSRISTKGYGDANPVASNDTPEGRKQNRRIEVSIVK